MDLLPEDLELAHLEQVGQVEQRLYLRLVQHLLQNKINDHDGGDLAELLHQGVANWIQYKLGKQ